MLFSSGILHFGKPERESFQYYKIKFGIPKMTLIRLEYLQSIFSSKDTLNINDIILSCTLYNGNMTFFQSMFYWLNLKSPKTSIEATGIEPHKFRGVWKSKPGKPDNPINPGNSSNPGNPSKPGNPGKPGT